MKTETHPTSEIVERICSTRITGSQKLVRLFAVAMIDYRGPVGDLAWEKIREVTGEDYASALAFISGFVMGATKEMPNAERWRELVPELQDK
jgi:hypothetical protein